VDKERWDRFTERMKEYDEKLEVEIEDETN